MTLRKRASGGTQDVKGPRRGNAEGLEPPRTPGEPRDDLVSRGLCAPSDAPRQSPSLTEARAEYALAAGLWALWPCAENRRLRLEALMRVAELRVAQKEAGGENAFPAGRLILPPSETKGTEQ